MYMFKFQNMLKCCGIVWSILVQCRAAMAFGKCPSAPGSLLLFTTPWSKEKSRHAATRRVGNKKTAMSLQVSFPIGSMYGIFANKTGVY